MQHLILLKNHEILPQQNHDVARKLLQGERVQKDFNIVDEAGGAGKEIVKNFTAVVNNTALEIRFYYAGKGTNGLPYRGVYGPLISAISVMNHGKLNCFEFLVSCLRVRQGRPRYLGCPSPIKNA